MTPSVECNRISSSHVDRILLIEDVETHFFVITHLVDAV